MAVDLSGTLRVILTSQSKQITACDLRCFVVNLVELIYLHTGIDLRRVRNASLLKCQRSDKVCLRHIIFIVIRLAYAHSDL